MKSPVHALALLIAVAFVWGVIHLFGVEFAEGDVYPKYSSLRADPDGSKLLYESLAALPGIRISRNYLPLETLRGEGQTVVLLGVRAQDLAAAAPTLKRLAERGNRIVAAMNPDTAKPDSLLQAWGLALEVEAESGDRGARASFSAAVGWIEMERLGRRLLAIERAFGTGSVALLTESIDFSNESTVASDRLQLVTRALGHPQQIVFDESHLGIAESGSVVSLARKMRLSGLAMGLAICAALWIWRASSTFPPPRAAVRSDHLAGRTSQAGLLTMLRRNIAPRELTGVCWNQWLAFNRNKIPPERAQRAAAVARESRTPVDAAREIQRVIHAKGQL